MRPKIGLALGSGGARGFAHIGVLKVLEEENIPIDYLAGSSMGALVAALYGAGHSVANLERFATLFKRKYYIDFTVPKMGFITGKKVTELIRILSKHKKIEQLSPSVQIVATDLLKGERVIFKEGSVAQAVRASISIPGIFVPVKMGDTLLVDGGVIERVPVSVTKEMGADITIASDVSFFSTNKEIISIYDVILQTIDIMEREVVKNREVDATIMIKPMVKQVSAIAFTNVEEYIALGEEQARKQIPFIQHEIEKWKENMDGHRKKGEDEDK
ncbi:patatin-like phospholipase family protein [Bacillus alkalicellulosilyticus]|uniref:patatin-like phospholipase family protein n=1 Tax=Alkalihalobacterium alkalicellulosilyticum TaxID=1912214 RepID=UPI0009973896|nr:patatin-like phospholipase family protein [Bacillus alkalicellulosilyticus]